MWRLASVVEPDLVKVASYMAQGGAEVGACHVCGDPDNQQICRELNRIRRYLQMALQLFGTGHTAKR